MSFLDTIRRQAGKSTGSATAAASAATLPIRLSGTNPAQEYDVNLSPSDADAELGTQNGRTGNDWPYPDTQQYYQTEVITGDRLQDFANTHLSENPESVGRIPRQWDNRILGKVGRDITGNPSGDNSAPITVTGNSAGGIADMQYVPHTPTPRNTTVARPYMRTIDDAASIPGVYVADATRR